MFRGDDEVHDGHKHRQIDGVAYPHGILGGAAYGQYQ